MRSQMSLLEETLAEERERKIEKENEFNSIKRLLICTENHTYLPFQLTTWLCYGNQCRFMYIHFIKDW